MRAFIEKHKLLSAAVVTVFICILMLAVIEIRQPYFFLQDDNADSYICQYVYSLRSVSEGEFPYYNFNQLSGQPFLDKGQTGQLNVFVYAGGLLSKIFLGHLCGTVDFVASLYLIAGAVGMLLFIKKRLDVNYFIAVTGAIAWSFNSFSIYCGGNWLVSIILTGCLPWLFLSTAYLYEHDGLKAILLAAVPKVFLFYCGHPQYFIYGIIFDYLYMVSYILVYKDKGTRLKAEGKFTLKYFLSGLAVTLWSLPLLGPMYSAMTSSTDRSGRFSLESFMLNRYKLKDLLSGLVFPINNYDITEFEEVDGVQVGVIDQIDALQRNMSHIGIILLVAVLIALVHLSGALKKKNPEVMSIYKMMLTFVPCGVIALLWGSSYWFNRIMYFVPIINRFRYPFKLIQYFLFFLILAACLSLKIIIKETPSIRRKQTAAGVALVVFEIINLTAVYIVQPGRFFGVYTRSEIPYREVWEDDFRNGRLVPVMAHPDYWDWNNLNEYDLPTRTAYDDAATMRSNYPTYYGFESISGYDILLTAEQTFSNYNIRLNNDDIGGNIGDVYDGMVEEMRRHAVNLYVTLPSNADYVESKLAPYGIIRLHEDEDHVLFYDEMAQPRAYSGDDFAPVDLQVHVNYLTVTTPADFEGGSVTVNYVRDHRFVATIDGQPANITGSDDFSDMTVSGIPEGEHEIVFRFVENTFRICLAVTVSGTLILAAALCFTSHKKQRKLS